MTMRRNRGIIRTVIPIFLICGQAVLGQSGVKTFEISTPNSFKILVATDLHCDKHDANDLHTFSGLDTIIHKYGPDLLVVTGDLTTNLGLTGLQWVVDHIAALNIPWAFARGNHDNGPSADPTNFTQCHAYLSAAANSLHAGTTAYPNYRVEIRNKGQSTPVWNLFIIDDCWTLAGSTTGGFQQAQIDWFNAEVARIGVNPPAFVFFHINLPQYQDVWNCGAACSVGGSKLDNIENAGLTGAFTAFVNSKIVAGTWCGHDHLNDFHGILNGIYLSYARSSGYGGYGQSTFKKGATLISVDAAKKTFTAKAVFADDVVAQNTTAGMHPSMESPSLWFDGATLHIHANGEMKAFRLFDMRGMEVYRQTIPARQTHAVVNLRLPSGIYEALFYREGIVKCEKAVKPE